MGYCTVNRLNMRNAREQRPYQALLIDLVNLEVVEKEDAEALLGYTIPSYLLNSNSEPTPEPSPDDDDDNDDDDDGNDDTGSGNTISG